VSNNRKAAWRKDPCAFITEVLRDPETGAPFELYEGQMRFLREALTLTKDGWLQYPEVIFACPKKSGKTETVVMTAWLQDGLGQPRSGGVAFTLTSAMLKRDLAILTREQCNRCASTVNDFCREQRSADRQP